MIVKTGEVLDFIMHGMGRDWDNKIEYVEQIKLSFLSYGHTGAENEEFNLSVPISFEKN